MTQYKPVWIACPQYTRLVRGRYACDAEGRFRLGPDGHFLLDRACCDQFGGRCMATLCALHRFNRGGPGTWYPGRIYASRRAEGRRKRRPGGPPPTEAPGRGLLA